jgi:hypothetical protein
LLTMSATAKAATCAVKTADCPPEKSLTPPIPAVFTPLHCIAASDPLRWLALSFRCIPTLELSKTDGMNRLCHVSCSCHEPRQPRPLKRIWFWEKSFARFQVVLRSRSICIGFQFSPSPARFTGGHFVVSL